jgi:hypothetical protein
MIDFPSNPTDKQQYSNEGRSWEWNAAKTAWLLVPVSSADATSAANSAASALESKNQALASKDVAVEKASIAEAAANSFDARYLGAKAVAPTVDNKGAALVSGALYFNISPLESGGGMKTYSTSSGTWSSAYAPLIPSTVTSALGYTPANKAGDTFAGNVHIANGTDSRVNLQVGGVIEGILTASATNIRLSSANGIPMTFGTNGVTRLTLTGTGFITTGDSEYVGIGQQAGTNNSLRIARNLTNDTSAFGVLSDGTFQSGVTNVGMQYRSIARTAAAPFTMAGLYHYQAFQAALGAGSAITTQVGFLADASLTSATNNYGFRGQIAAGTNRFNLYMDGTADNFLGGNLIQAVSTTAATLNTDGTLTFSIVNNTTLRVSVRGSDGVTRTGTVSLA